VVKEVNGSIYQFADPELGHVVHVDFLETGLYLDTGLNYALTIHKIIPGERPGHFEKIFGSYAITGLAEEFPDEEPAGESDDIRLKDTAPYKRSASAEKMVRQVHSQLQNAFAAWLKKTYPNDPVKTERSRIDINQNILPGGAVSRPACNISSAFYRIGQWLQVIRLFCRWSNNYLAVYIIHQSQWLIHYLIYLWLRRFCPAVFVLS
jgi:hypothetical protein